MARYRKNGLQYPFSSYQRNAIIFYPIITIMFYIMILLIEQSNIQLISLLIPYSLLVLIVLITWYYVELIDPVEVKGVVTPKLICFKKSKVTTRYCGTCHKSVEGLDHHCLWLNTCIGSKNYIPFFILVSAGFFQTGLQLITGIFYITIWFSSNIKSRIDSSLPANWVYILLICIQCTFAGIIFIGFGTLLAFHLYLLFWAHMGTYEWLLSRGDPTKGEDSYSEIQQKYLADQAERYEREKAWAQTMSKTRTPTNKQLSMSQMNSTTITITSATATASSTPSATPIMNIPITQSEKNNIQNMESFLKPFNSCELMIPTDNTNIPTNRLNDSKLIPSSDFVNETPTDLELTPLNDDSSVAGHYPFYPHDNTNQHQHQHQHQHQNNNSQKSENNNNDDNNNNNNNKNKNDQTVFRSLYLKAAQVFPLTNSPISSKTSKNSRGANQPELSPHQEISYHSILSHHESSHYSANHDQPAV